MVIQQFIKDIKKNMQTEKSVSVERGYRFEEKKEVQHSINASFFFLTSSLQILLVPEIKRTLCVMPRLNTTKKKKKSNNNNNEIFVFFH